MVRLLLLAITVVPIRFGLLFLSDYAGTLAMLEALTRLRHAIYHHTLCLGRFIRLMRILSYVVPIS